MDHFLYNRTACNHNGFVHSKIYDTMFLLTLADVAIENYYYIRARGIS